MGLVTLPAGDGLAGRLRQPAPYCDRSLVATYAAGIDHRPPARDDGAGKPAEPAGATPGGPPQRSVPSSRPALFAGIGAILLALLVLLDVLRPAGRGFLTVTAENVDSICYFATTHSMLFDGDFDLANQFSKMPAEMRPMIATSRWTQTIPATGRPGSPYPLGYSLLGLAPLAVGTAIDRAVGAPADGFGHWAVRCFAAASILWLTIGLYFLHSWLLDLGARWGSGISPRESWTLAVGLSMLPATALGYYAFTVMSHTASFLAVSLFLRLWYRRRQSLGARDWATVGAAGGAVVLCRWPELLLLLIPPAYELLRWNPAVTWRLRGWWTSRLLAVAVAALVVTPQLWQWRSIYGAFLLVPQGEAFLAWPPRWTLEVLFSSWNGLFFTTPATMLGAAGLAWAAVKDRVTALPLLLALVVMVALTGSQPTNWHGWAFAMRNLIGSTPLIAAGLLFVVLQLPSARWIVAAALLVGSSFTLLGAIQWRYELVPRRDRLTFEEAFSNKLRLPRALARDRAMRTALANFSEPAAQVEALEAALRQYGESRVLLRRLEEAARKAGASELAERSAHRLMELDKRRLF